MGLTKKNILITGLPGIGKTTLVKKLSQELKHLHPAGFYTEEIREEGVRKGFELVSLNGKRGVLSHIHIKSPHRVGKYKVDIEAFENLLDGIPFFSPSTQLIIIDEIGKMECFSDSFKNLLKKIFNSEKLVIATIAMKGNGLIAEIKERQDIQLFELNSHNRDALFLEILKELMETSPTHPSPLEGEGWVGGITISWSQRNHDMSILLITVGEVEIKVIETLKFDLARAFKKKVWVRKGMPRPDDAFNKKRSQYLSTAILKAMMEKKEYASYEKVLGIIDHDLYVPKLNFVFGEASQRVAIISLTRLRHEFYNLPEDQSLFRKRVLTEAVHELGHTYGVRHCGNPHCVMFFSNSLIDTDMKGPAFCQRCKSNLNKDK